MSLMKDLSPSLVGNCQPFGHIESGARPPDHWIAYATRRHASATIGDVVLWIQDCNAEDEAARDVDINRT